MYSIDSWNLWNCFTIAEAYATLCLPNPFISGNVRGLTGGNICHLYSQELFDQNKQKKAKTLKQSVFCQVFLIYISYQNNSSLTYRSKSV